MDIDEWEQLTGERANSNTTEKDKILDLIKRVNTIGNFPEMSTYDTYLIVSALYDELDKLNQETDDQN